MKKMILISAALICCAVFLNAGEHDYTIGITLNLDSEILNEERSVIVYTPETYTLGDQHYPVMYLLDGDAHFHHASGIARFLAGNGIIPEMIVVAVRNIDRTRDFSPTHVEKRPTSGGAKKFMSFLADELIPFIDNNYRTMPYDVLVGHSFGGEFAAYALLNRPEVFNVYEKAKLKADYDQVQFYMTVGNEPAYFETLAEFTKIIEDRSPAGLELSYVKMDKENHVSVPHLSIYRGLENIYKDWRLSNETFQEGLAAIDHHYEKISGKYKCQVATPEYTINLLGYQYLNNNQTKKAIKIFIENVERFPESANVYDSLGEAFETNEQFDKAEENYKLAVDIAIAQKHPNLTIYEMNLQRMQEKIAQK